MSKPIVVDASVATKWFVTEPKGRETALSVLEELRSAPAHFLVPELFFNEMLHVLCKLLKNEKRVIECLSLLEDLGLERVPNGTELLREAAHLSLKHGLSGYDGIYAATAKMCGGLWLTFDGIAAKKIEKLGIVKALG